MFRKGKRDRRTVLSDEYVPFVELSTVRVWESDATRSVGPRLPWSVLSDRYSGASAGEAEHARLVLRFVNALNASDAVDLADFEKVVLAEESEYVLEDILGAAQSQPASLPHVRERISLLQRLQEEWNYDEVYFDFLLNRYGRLRRADDQPERLNDPPRVALQLLRLGHDVEAIRAMLQLARATSGVGTAYSATCHLWLVRVADLLDHANQFPLDRMRLSGEAGGLCDESMVERFLSYARHSRRRGEYVDQLRLCLAALTFAQMEFGDRHPLTIDAYLQLATAGDDMGDRSTAFGATVEAGYYQSSMSSGTTRSLIAMTHRAALEHRNEGNIEFARELTQRFRDDALDHDLAARRLYLESLLSLDEDHQEAALVLIDESLATLGPAGDDDLELERADAFHLKGVLAALSGDWSLASDLVGRAAKLRVERLGPRHSSSVDSLVLRGLAHFLVEPSTGLEEIRQAIETETAAAANLMSTGSGTGRRVAEEELFRHFCEILSVLLLSSPDPPTDRVAELAYSLVLRRKGLSTDVDRLFSRVLDEEWSESIHIVDHEIRLERNVATPRTRRRAIQREVDRRTIANQSYDLSDGSGSLIYGDARSLRETIEMRIIEPHRSEVLDNLSVLTDSDSIQRILGALDADAALIDYIRLDVPSRVRRVASGKSFEDSGKYFAFVLMPSEDQPLEVFDLGSAKEIDDFIAEFRDAISHGGDSARDVGPANARMGSSHAGTELRRLLLDPIIAKRVGRRRLIVSPDGELWRMPFDCLPRHPSGYIIDDYCIRIVGTSRDLIRQQPDGPMPTTPLVVGAPDFDNDARGDTQAAPSVARMLAPLPGARDEAMSIAQFLGVRALTDASASKPALLLTRSPRVLHVATHAYYLPPAELHAEAGSPTVVSDALPSRGLSRIAAVDDPMLRAGVALSGANNTLQHVETAVDIDSGLLSAREILSMDLRRTELVVLSACDTGLGAIVPGRTVAGLPRAFIVAGADSVVMSLWKVPDASTSALMKCFYRELSKGVSTADALRVAKLAAMKDCPHPRDWAAFICYGSDRLITATPDTAQPSEARDESEDDDGSNSPQPVSSNPLKLVPRP